MRSIPEWFDLARETAQLNSDRRLADALKVSQPVVSQMRRGFIKPSEATMVRLAELAQRPAEEALLDLVLSKATTDEERAAWGRIRQRVVAAAVALAIGCAVMPGTSGAQAATGCEELYIITNCGYGCLSGG